MDDDERRRAPRKEISSTVEFVVEGGHVMQAVGLDLSETGIGFEAADPLTVALTVTVEGREITRLARLARVSPTDDDSYLFGLEFIEPLSSPQTSDE